MAAEILRNSLSPEIVRYLKSYSPISFDLDGVVVDLAPVAIQRYNFLHGGTYTMADLDDVWRMADWYSQRYGCSREQAIEETKTVWNCQESIEGALPLEGATEILEFLESADVEHYFITSRPVTTAEFTSNWFKKHIQGHGISRLTLQNDLEYNKDFKVNKVRDLKIKVHFEDMPEHALRITEETDALVVLVNQPGNRNFQPGNPKIIRPAGLHTEGSLIHSFARLIDHIQTVGIN